MTRLQDKAQGATKQAVGQMVGDDKLVLEGKDQVRKAEGEQHSDHGIVRNEKGEEQPKERQRAQTAHKTDAKDSASKEETRK